MTGKSTLVGLDFSSKEGPTEENIISSESPKEIPYLLPFEQIPRPHNYISYVACFLWASQRRQKCPFLTMASCIVEL